MSCGGHLQMCKNKVSQCIESTKEKLSALSKKIWSTPELAFQEHEAHKTLTYFFQEVEQGWKVQCHYKLDTAFRAEWEIAGSGGPGTCAVNVGFLCEYDALPEIGHACGHNLIAETGAAAALGLKGALQSLPAPPVGVKITVLGTPAEEGAGGKIDLLQSGAFEDLDVVFMAHPAHGDISYLPLLAAQGVTVKYYGKASHAAAHPWEGVNALDAAVLAYNNLSVLRQQLKPDCRLHGIIKHGGAVPNVIPDYSELYFYLRTSAHNQLHDLREKAGQCFRAAAIATGCKVECFYEKNVFYNIRPNKTLEKLYMENGKQLGIEFTTDKSTLKSLTASTDFGNVSFVVPGIHPFFYIGSTALVHTKEYTTASGAETAQFYTLRTAKALAMTALDVIFKPEMLQQVKDEFRCIKEKEKEKEESLDKRD
ncbi:peptidase M20 domain-containing protein 2-like [Protopterus annectens]|uniref:peptidase M20 domain-containing protein 2-like n=1 Tax=Protopterus annectens TaxID=7888 RepID=UPI001CFB5F97|nr:peptidase M20 domain-containing protein 2-like [Protopterus annectens]